MISLKKEDRLNKTIYGIEFTFFLYFIQIKEIFCSVTNILY